MTRSTISSNHLRRAQGKTDVQKTASKVLIPADVEEVNTDVKVSAEENKTAQEAQEASLTPSSRESLNRKKEAICA